ncbi:MAG: hypothetical protein O7H39_05395 [Gammaproteobacteria bacterium]|nr:hypothetical protein [Gammaproteobacteria bacterium]
MSVLEIVQLTNGDVALVDPDSQQDPLVLIRFSRRVQDLLGSNSLGVAEAMIGAATELMDPSNEPRTATAAGAVIH